MAEIKLKAKVSYAYSDTVDLEFGRTQCDMNFSGSGGIQKKLKLKEGDKVEVTIRKV